MSEQNLSSASIQKPRSTASLNSLVLLRTADEGFAEDEDNDRFLDIFCVTRRCVAYNTNHSPRGARKYRSR
jgi:hypothetical protein